MKEHLQTSIFVNFHQVTLYPPCIHTAVFINHLCAVDKSLMVSWWSSKTCAVYVFLICWVERCKLMVDANPLVNSLHPLPKWCGLSTPLPNTSINWQWISRVEKFCLYKLSHHKVFCMTEFPLSLPLQINLSPK